MPKRQRASPSSSDATDATTYEVGARPLSSVRRVRAAPDPCCAFQRSSQRQWSTVSPRRWARTRDGCVDAFYDAHPLKRESYTIEVPGEGTFYPYAPIASTHCLSHTVVRIWFIGRVSFAASRRAASHSSSAQEDEWVKESQMTGCESLLQR
jgi:hypothetical protein